MSVPAPPPVSAPRRAVRSFWILGLLAVVAMGALSAALTAQPGPLTGLIVAGAGLVLVAALTLAARVLLALERARHAPGDPTVLR